MDASPCTADSRVPKGAGGGLSAAGAAAVAETEADAAADAAEAVTPSTLDGGAVGESLAPRSESGARCQSGGQHK